MPEGKLLRGGDEEDEIKSDRLSEVLDGLLPAGEADPDDDLRISLSRCLSLSLYAGFLFTLPC